MRVVPGPRGKAWLGTRAVIAVALLGRSEQCLGAGLEQISALTS